MAQVQPLLRIEIDPTKPVPEICAVIGSVMPYHAGQEKDILQGLETAIQKRLSELKGAEKPDDKQVRESSRNGQNQG